MAQIPAKTKDHPDVKAMEKRREEQTKSNEEAMKRMESTTPTPTQEENDLARLGVMVDDKQDDGSGPTVIRTTTVANVPLGAEPPDVEVTPQNKAERDKASQAERERAERERAAQQAKAASKRE